MKALIILIVIMTSLLASENDKQTITGYLQQFGSEPFPQLAVVTRDNERIFLDLTTEQYEELQKKRKEFIRIKGKIHQKEFLGEPHPYISPHCWKWIDKPEDW